MGHWPKNDKTERATGLGRRRTEKKKKKKKKRKKKKERKVESNGSHEIQDRNVTGARKKKSHECGPLAEKLTRQKEQRAG